MESIINKGFKVGQSVTYISHPGARPEHGRVSTVKEQEDGTQKVWVKYGMNTTGALSPTDKLT